MSTRLFVGAAVAAALLGGCGSGSDAGRVSDSSTDAKERSVLVYEFQFKRWPLTIRHGELLCQHGTAVVFRTPTGVLYGVNGTSHGFGYRDIDHIWKTSKTGDRIGDMGPLIDRGLKLCEEA